MELRAYLSTLLRRWYLVALVPVLVALGVVYQAFSSQPTYTATSRLSVLRASDQPNLEDRFRYDSYYLYLSSEFAVDDLVEVVKGNVFAADVAQALRERRGIDVSEGQVQQALSSTRRHRILTINARSQDTELATQIAQVAAEELERRGTAYFGVDPEGTSLIQTIQRATGAGSDLARQRLLYLLQIAVAVFAGVVLAFLVDYLDDTLRSPDTVQNALNLPVIGMIPSERGVR